MQKEEGEVLSHGRQINERAPEQGGKRDREKVTKVHFIEFWVAVLRSAQVRTLQVNKFRSFPRESNGASRHFYPGAAAEISRYREITRRLLY